MNITSIVDSDIIPATGYNIGSNEHKDLNTDYYPNENAILRTGGINIGSSTEPFANLYVGNILMSNDSILQLGNANITSSGNKIDLPAGSTIGGVTAGMIKINGSLPNASFLPQKNTEVGDSFMVNNNLWVCSSTNPTTVWTNLGTIGIQGPQGAQGPPGQNTISSPINITNDYTIEISNGHSYYSVNSTNNSITLTLPTITSVSTTQVTTIIDSFGNASINNITIISTDIPINNDYKTQITTNFGSITLINTSNRWVII
jgi:hypothetical protein